MKVHKDRLFIFVVALVCAGLAYQGITRLINMFDNSTLSDWRQWLLIFVNIFAFYYCLILLNNNRKRIRLAKGLPADGKK